MKEETNRFNSDQETKIKEHIKLLQKICEKKNQAKKLEAIINALKKENLADDNSL